MSDVYLLESWLWLPAPREEVFRFFADARNLERITPAFLRFHVVGPGPIDMRQGTRIDYRLSLHGLPLRWKSAITEWEPPARFVDSQLRGPYSSWVHTHTFEDHEGGTMVRDNVRYALPGPWFVTRAVNRFFVAPDITRIFEFRHARLMAIFNARTSSRAGPVTIRPART